MSNTFNYAQCKCAFLYDFEKILSRQVATPQNVCEIRDEPVELKQQPQRTDWSDAAYHLHSVLFSHPCDLIVAILNENFIHI